MTFILPGRRAAYDAGRMSPFWIGMQVVIVVCVIASIVIAAIKL
jgi:hypothetical protein